jgi:hypothetical protein
LIVESGTQEKGDIMPSKKNEKEGFGFVPTVDVVTEAGNDPDERTQTADQTEVRDCEPVTVETRKDGSCSFAGAIRAIQKDWNPQADEKGNVGIGKADCAVWKGIITALIAMIGVKYPRTYKDPKSEKKVVRTVEFSDDWTDAAAYLLYQLASRFILRQGKQYRTMKKGEWGDWQFRVRMFVKPMAGERTGLYRIADAFGLSHYGDVGPVNELDDMMGCLVGAGLIERDWRSAWLAGIQTRAGRKAKQGKGRATKAERTTKAKELLGL